MIPLVLLIIVSYPPLVGHESTYVLKNALTIVIGILIGLVWGLGEGFAILAAGTFIGEILLWFSFKWCCTNAASKFERKNKLYWSLTQLIREKVRLSASIAGPSSGTILWRCAAPHYHS